MEPVQIEVHRLHVVTIRHDMSATEFLHWNRKKYVRTYVYYNLFKSMYVRTYVRSLSKNVRASRWFYSISVRTYVPKIQQYGTCVEMLTPRRQI